MLYTQISRPGGSAVGVDRQLRSPRGRRRASGLYSRLHPRYARRGLRGRHVPEQSWIPARPRAGGEKVHRLGLARLHQPVGVGHSRGCAHFRQKDRSAAHMQAECNETLLRGGGGMRCVIYYSIISLAGTAVNHPGSIAQQPSERPGFATAGVRRGRPSKTGLPLRFAPIPSAALEPVVFSRLGQACSFLQFC